MTSRYRVRKARSEAIPPVRTRSETRGLPGLPGLAIFSFFCGGDLL